MPFWVQVYGFSSHLFYSSSDCCSLFRGLVEWGFGLTGCQLLPSLAWSRVHLWPGAPLRHLWVISWVTLCLLSLVWFLD